jgi:transcriptional regulator with XRE-family HTH domain
MKKKQNPVGIRIRKLREDRGIRQYNIAIELDISQSTYSKLEKDDRRLSAERLVKIAKVLKLPVAVFFGEKESGCAHAFESNHLQSFCRHGEESLTSLKEEVGYLKNEIHFLKEDLNFLKIIVKKQAQINPDDFLKANNTDDKKRKAK